MSLNQNHHRGARSHLAGRAAEQSVERVYADRGYAVAHRRFRASGGEIDLILRNAEQVVFVEVKQSATLAHAAEALTQRQLTRIHEAATEFLAGEPLGQDTPSRIDAALMDGQGHIEILENILAA